MTPHELQQLTRWKFNGDIDMIEASPDGDYYSIRDVEAVFAQLARQQAAPAAIPEGWRAWLPQHVAGWQDNIGVRQSLSSPEIIFLTISRHEVQLYQNEFAFLLEKMLGYAELAAPAQPAMPALLDHAHAEPVKFNDAQREAVRDALSATLGDAMDCTRVWSAWGVGTMSQDDFELLADNDERLEELVDAVEKAASQLAAQPNIQEAGNAAT